MIDFDFHRMLAVAERDLRRFRRNTKLFIPMALMPIIYLIILGKSMGGDLHDLPVALVVQDHGEAAVEVRDRILTLAQSRELFRLNSEPDPSTAVRRLREGDYKAVVIVPPDFSEDFSRGEAAPLGVVVDNTDNTSAGVIEGELRRAFSATRTAGRQGAV
jgi:ABC-2 type transport system permease protein